MALPPTDISRKLRKQIEDKMTTGSQYTDVSVASLSAGQAAGTTSVIAANAARKGIKIIPPSDCILKIVSGATGGVPLFGGVANDFSGPECPINALYLSGLLLGAAVTIWEA
ncbi:hypothetical protein CG471_01970 [Sphingobium sp. IP1]|uniref:hypothetical protein n=1 Tax=Sphingobium sp. IP1 TaxID=2021637 RepID=UPI000C06DFCA|nr:hypothetical protein [Sphingobium sp. IP1]PHP21359.1 hypothetical protein CG471_01970 [Sphingobium sp. IP1]